MRDLEKKLNQFVLEKIFLIVYLFTLLVFYLGIFLENNYYINL